MHPGERQGQGRQIRPKSPGGTGRTSSGVAPAGSGAAAAPGGGFARAIYPVRGGTGGGGLLSRLPGAPGPTRGLIFPFPTRSGTMFGRLDQGVDLQYKGTTVVPIRAIAAGILGTSSDPGGFGPSYPVLHLAKPIAGQSAVYYGHVNAVPGLVGKRVRAGQVIAYSGGHTSQGNAAGLPNWLEIGFFGPSGPVAGTAARMRQILGGTRTYGQARQRTRLVPGGGIGRLPTVAPAPHGRGGRAGAPSGRPSPARRPPRPHRIMPPRPQRASLMAFRAPARRAPAPRRAPVRRRILGGRII